MESTQQRFVGLQIDLTNVNMTPSYTRRFMSHEYLYCMRVRVLLMSVRFAVAPLHARAVCVRVSSSLKILIILLQLTYIAADIVTLAPGEECESNAFGYVCLFGHVSKKILLRLTRFLT